MYMYFWKELPFVVFVFCLFVILAISHFGFKDETSVLGALVPGHCTPFYLS